MRLEPLAHVTLLLAALLACKGGSPRDDPGVGPTPRGAPEVATAVPIKTLLSEYKDNEIRSDGKWKGKYIQVTGTVHDVKKDIVGSPYVTLGTGPAFEIPKVQCMLDSSSVSRASSLSKGNGITVKGHVKGKIMNVLLDDCTIN